MADANLLYALRKQGKNPSLKNVVVLGRVRCAIKRPSIVGDNIEVGKGFFAIIDAFALKCLGDDYFAERGYSNLNNIYFTKGSMVIFINSRDWIGKCVKVYGKSKRSGINIRQQWNKKSEYDGITAFQFSYSDGNFVIVPNILVEIGDRDVDAGGTVLSDIMASIVGNNNGIISYPVSLNTIVPYTGAEDYTELSDSEIDSLEVKFIDNGDSNRIDISSIKMDLEHHMEGVEIAYSAYDVVLEEVETMTRRRYGYAKTIKNLISEKYSSESKDDFDYSEYGYEGDERDVVPTWNVASNIIELFIANIAEHYNENIGDSKNKGRYFIEELRNILTNNSPLMSSDDGGVEDSSDSPELIAAALELFSNTVIVDPSILLGDTGTMVDSIPILNHRVSMAIAVFSVISGISYGDFKSNYNMCRNYHKMDVDSWFWTLIHVPYYLGLLGCSLGLEDLDVVSRTIHRVFGSGMFEKENRDTRNQLAMLVTLKELSSEETFIHRRNLYRPKIEYGSRELGYLYSCGLPVKKGYVEALRVVFGNGTIIPSNERTKLVEYDWYSKELEKFLTYAGLVNDVNGYIVLMKDLDKEFAIYDKFVHMGHEDTGITDSMIEETIAKFEESRGFTLEPLQRDAIYLCKKMSGVLSGCAGSGKTTTSDCMSEVLKQLEGYELLYCTPTGKACRRLAEVVKAPVKTLHSQFGIGIFGESFLTEASCFNKDEEAEVKNIYLCDEMAMCSTYLMYNIAINMKKGDMCFFFGDIRQLPPIGKGLPFRVLMKLLPCVELGVSKRAAEGSLINYNTTLINHMSDGVLRELLYDDSTFMCRDCSDAEIPEVVCKEWSTLMGRGISEDDIQVITGYQKSEIPFSAPRLNPPIQRMLRSGDKLLFTHKDREFYENDRIIHLNRNDYSMCRYIEESPNVFKQVLPVGVVNGETGRMVGIIRSDFASIDMVNAIDCQKDPLYEHLSEDSIGKLIDIWNERCDGLRRDAKLRSDKYYFIKVEVYDVDLERNVLVLYRAREVLRDGVTCFEGSDLGNIDLAYALTTHKMQGSQSRAVILALGGESSASFINRNMLNTMVTRSQEIVSCVGSVRGIDSTMNKGRMEKVSFRSNDLLSFLSGEMSG